MSAKPKPDITDLNAPFWEGTAKGELRVRQCNACGARFRFTHPWCTSCWSSDLGWIVAKGTGVIATFSVLHVAPYEAFNDRLPYVLALIDLDEGVRMMANIVDCDPKNVRIGLPVKVIYEDRDGVALPQYVLADAGRSGAMSAAPKLVSVTFDGALAIVTLDRPGALNALGTQLLDDLDTALDAAEQHPDARVVILTGGLRAFSVGGDLKEADVDAAERVARMHALALRLLQSYAKITIAAIEGWALGGGLEIAMACTFRVAAPGARLGVPEIAMGLIPGFGGTQLLPRLVGPAKAIALLCDGEPVDAETALRIGLVDLVAAAKGEALSCARTYAGRFTRHSPAAQRTARLAVWEGFNLPLDQALTVERHHLQQLRGATDVPEGILEFRKGRKNVTIP